MWQDANEDVAGLSATMKELGISGPESTAKVVVGVVDLDKAQKAATVTADGYADAVGDASWADRFATGADKAVERAKALEQHFSAATRKAIDLIIAINNIPNAPSGTLPADPGPQEGTGASGCGPANQVGAGMGGSPSPPSMGGGNPDPPDTINNLSTGPTTIIVATTPPAAVQTAVQEAMKNPAQAEADIRRHPWIGG